MSRTTSPPPDARDPKRCRKSLESQEMPTVPESVAEVVPDGDAWLIVSGMSAAPEKQIGLRVSSIALSMTSSVFKADFANIVSKTVTSDERSPSLILELSKQDNGDAMFILCNILHLRNDKLALRIPPDLLFKVAILARKYDCVVAASRATVQWFDRLYTANDPGNVWRIIEAAYLLDEATFFARFTSRWILTGTAQGSEMPFPSCKETAQLSLFLSAQHTAATILLRNDLDTLITPSISTFSKNYKHYIDWAPTLSPEPDDTPEGKSPVECRVDSDGAALYLGALQDAGIWPPTAWIQPKAGKEGQMKGITIGNIVEKVVAFREPEYDDTDKCEFCEGVKGKFLEALEKLRRVHRERLWGLCLDCFKMGAVYPGECRFEHAKPARGAGGDMESQGL